MYDWGVLVHLRDGVLEGVFGMCWSDLGIGINLAHGDSGSIQMADLTVRVFISSSGHGSLGSI